MINVAWLKETKWQVVGMLWLVSFINYADRNAVTAVMPMLRSDFDLNNTLLGLVSSSFLWVYAVSSLLVGYLGDRFSRKWVIIWGLSSWSLMTFLSPLASLFPLFLLLRALTGLGEACYYPAGTALISDYHDKRTRGRALSVHQTAVFAGGAIGTTGAAWLAADGNWHFPFYLYGVIGLLFALFLARFMPGNSQARNARLESLAGKSPYALLAKNKAVWLLCLVYFCANSVSNGLLIWAPTLFIDSLHMSVTSASLYGALSLNLAGFVAVLLSGVVSDRVVKRSGVGRIYVLASGLLLAMLFIFAIAYVTTPAIMAACLLCAGFFKGIFDGSIYATMHDLVPSRSRSTATGLMTTLGFLGAGLCPLMIGIGADHIGLPLSMSLTAILDVIAVILLLAGRPLFKRAISQTAHLAEE